MHGLLSFFLSLRAIMLIGSLGALMGSLLMFLQGERSISTRPGTPC